MPQFGRSWQTEESSVGQIVHCDNVAGTSPPSWPAMQPCRPRPAGNRLLRRCRPLPLKHETWQKTGSSAESLPQTIGRYTVLRKLGAGAMGVVWLAHDPNLDRDVAIKVLAVQIRDADFLKRFLREVAWRPSCITPHRVTIDDVGAEGDQAYMVMELVEGGSLEKATSPDRPMDWREVTRVIRDAALGLAAAHERAWFTAISSRRTACAPPRA